MTRARAFSLSVLTVALAQACVVVPAFAQEPAAPGAPMDLRPHVASRKPAPPAVRPAQKPETPAAEAAPAINLDDIPKLVLRDPAAVEKAQQAKIDEAKQAARPTPPTPTPRPKRLAKRQPGDAHLALAAARQAEEAKAQAEAKATSAKPSSPTSPADGKAAAAQPEPAKPVVATKAEPPVDPDVIQQFCTNLSSAASSGRLAWQAKRLEEIDKQMRTRIAELEAKRKETAEWVARREDMLKTAEEAVVAIYSKMRPDAAAAQFTAMDESGAASILIKLNPRLASTVLNEIEPARAARIAAEMAGVGARREVARSVP